MLNVELSGQLQTELSQAGVYAYAGLFRLRPGTIPTWTTLSDDGVGATGQGTMPLTIPYDSGKISSSSGARSRPARPAQRPDHRIHHRSGSTGATRPPMTTATTASRSRSGTASATPAPHVRRGLRPADEPRHYLFRQYNSSSRYTLTADQFFDRSMLWLRARCSHTPKAPLMGPNHMGLSPRRPWGLPRGPGLPGIRLGG